MRLGIARKRSLLSAVEAVDKGDLVAIEECFSANSDAVPRRILSKPSGAGRKTPQGEGKDRAKS